MYRSLTPEDRLPGALRHELSIDEDSSMITAVSLPDGRCQVTINSISASGRSGTNSITPQPAAMYREGRCAAEWWRRQDRLRLMGVSESEKSVWKAHFTAGNGESPTPEKSAKRGWGRTNICAILNQLLWPEIFNIFSAFIRAWPACRKIDFRLGKHLIQKSSQRLTFGKSDLCLKRSNFLLRDWASESQIKAFPFNHQTKGATS